MNTSDIVMKIRKGELDCNNQELFFSNLIKGLIVHLNKDITIRGMLVPHQVMHTGDDIMYLDAKYGQDDLSNPLIQSGENYVYNTIPRCTVSLSNMDIQLDQLTNPYTYGTFQLDVDNSLYTLGAEFRRIPVKLNVSLKYYTDSYTDTLELIQQIISKLSFIQTYDIVYMGQHIICSYKIPESFSEEHTLELDGTSTDNKCHIMELSLEVESCFPIYERKTVVSTADGFVKAGFNTGLYNKHGISNGDAPIDQINIIR